ncbi:hypothetical protein FJT64_004322 [Amphibalanus amphitrite]|uniref:Uncharacterized protein n=1 Tax=Amphibalanus amphitrite TaxID=1232801 RepID=A0A6A4W8R8_AMPAM|nr:hypothetical protein FJT64_004322 [Amphibalanus amphitrite]
MSGQDGAGPPASGGSQPTKADGGEMDALLLGRLQELQGEPPWKQYNTNVHFGLKLPKPTKRTDPPELRKTATLEALAAYPNQDLTIWSDGSALDGTKKGGGGALLELHHTGPAGSARKKKGEPADASEQAHLSESCVENDQSLCSVDLAGDFTYRLVGVVQLNGGAKHSGYYLFYNSGGA